MANPLRSSPNAAHGLVAALLLGCSMTAMAADTPPASDATRVSAKVVSTQAALRDLWVGHVFWVREVVQGMVHKDSAAAEQAEKQVVANAKQIAGAIEPFYGQAASGQLFKLLAGHYSAVKAHATATVAGKTAEARTALDQLVANAGEISKFLSGANPNLPEDKLRGLLTTHGGHHVQQNQQFAAHDLAGEARTWEAMKDHMYVIADALAGAIAKQFPEKF
jgi:hypothetical protein